MSEPAGPLAGESYEGYVTVRALPPQGMISVRADLSAEGEGAAMALLDALGAEMPDRRGIAEGRDGAVLAWMSPDEAMVLCSFDGARQLAAGLDEALSDQHVLVADVSDARAVIELEGGAVREVIAKLAPVDMDAFAPGEIRRTRLAQVPAAFWMPEEGRLRLVCFRSVARYVFDLLATAARPGREVAKG
ncbi:MULTISPECIES: sarcosine oxidase subunit gamma [unclassified Rhodosalinus]|uniref:sarcosine oxidase subunit gamma n=1 Tax=unclassified Rhodosalinus TaxID=2630183 RepID=UPI003524C3B3